MKGEGEGERGGRREWVKTDRSDINLHSPRDTAQNQAPHNCQAEEATYQDLSNALDCLAALWLLNLPFAFDLREEKTK